MLFTEVSTMDTNPVASQVKIQTGRFNSCRTTSPHCMLRESSSSPCSIPPLNTSAHCMLRESRSSPCTIPPLKQMTTIVQSMGESWMCLLNNTRLRNYIQRSYWILLLPTLTLLILKCTHSGEQCCQSSAPSYNLMVLFSITTNLPPSNQMTSCHVLLLNGMIHRL
uniref:Uncharacterized protein n=1 Tax=Cacopsylla melanoneura TaxID=428564 RepID=A0A8D9A809_9HEMI